MLIEQGDYDKADTQGESYWVPADQSLHREQQPATGQAPTTDDLSVKKWTPHKYARWVKRLRNTYIFVMGLKALAGKKAHRNFTKSDNRAACVSSVFLTRLSDSRVIEPFIRMPLLG